MKSRRLAVLHATALMLLVGVAVNPGPVWAALGDPPDLYKAFYLEQAAKDPASAKALYDKLLATGLPADLRQVAQAGADRCRDHLAARNFASLMPENTLVYVELNRPGRWLEQLAGALGLTTKDMRGVLDSRPSVSSKAPFHVPQEVAISPALFEALQRFGGMAVALTSFDPDGGPPAGVLVAHHGDMLWAKGLLETAFQFAPTAEKIAEFPTFAAELPEGRHITGVLTEGLFIVGTSRDLVEGAVNRLIGSGSASLGNREDLAGVLKERREATLFAFADLQSILKVVRAGLGEHDQREFAVANALCDLNSLRWATFSTGIDDGALGLQCTLRLAENHNSLAYNLLRLPPMSRRSLRHVPPEAAAFIGLGLNPLMVNAAVDAAENAADHSVTGFDIGRELFGNIHELSVFIMPGEMTRRHGGNGPPVIPNVGVVLAVNDAARSKALWTQLLSLPGVFEGDSPVTPKAVEIGEREAISFVVPHFGKIFLAELDHCIALGSTKTVIEEIIQTDARERCVLNDPVMSKVIQNLPKDCTLMLVAHVGRLVKVAQGSGQPGVAIGASQAADLCENMVGWLGLGQSPNEMTVRAAVKGLPNVNAAFKRFGPMISAFSGLAMSRSDSNRPSVQQTPKERRAERRSKKADRGDKAPAVEKQAAPEKSRKAPSGSVSELTAKLIAAAQEEDYEKGLEYALAARDVEDSGLTNYNVACMYSRLNKKDKSFEYLFRAIELGMGDSGDDIGKLMRSDRDLDNIRKDPRFKKAMDMAEGKGGRSQSSEEETDGETL